MKILKKSLLFVLSAVMALGVFTACGSRSNENVLTITYYEGGFGSGWLETAVKDFVATKEGVSYELKPNPQVGSTVVTQLKSGKNLSDIYMVNGGSWQDWMSQGYLENLESVYESEVTTSKGQVKIKDYITSSIRDKYYLQRMAGQGEAYPWVLPWSMTSIGLFYNEDILLSTPHTTTKEGKWEKGDMWSAPPATVDELLQYCDDINATGKDISPMVFSGQESHWLQFLLYGWWAQYQGAEQENLLNVSADDGTYYDFWNFESAEVWKQEGIVAAIDTLRSFIVDTETGKWKNVPEGVNTYSTQDASRNFVTGKCAMILGGSFLYNEMSDYLDLDKDGKDDFTLKMMNLPYIDNAALDSEGNPLSINYMNNDDFMFVPAKATNKELAKEFLTFLTNEKYIVQFTQESGTLRPFDYDILELTEGTDFEFNAFTSSVLEVYNNSDVHLVRYPVGTVKEDVSLIYSYKPDVSISGQMQYATFVSKLWTTNGATLMQKVYDITKPEFEKWKLELGID